MSSRSLRSDSKSETVRNSNSQLPRAWKNINYPILKEHKFGRPSMLNLAKT